MFKIDCDGLSAAWFRSLTARCFASAFLFCFAVGGMLAQNPFLPLWEHIPDGEPYVFEDPDRPGHFRVYLYGSHDNLVTEYCGRDQVVWSAPVENLKDWRYDGVCFRHQQGTKADVLYAPDIVEVVEQGRKVYYFTPNNQAGGRKGMIARGTRPDGPFLPINNPQSVFNFDPAIMQDEDGRVYGYWGFGRSYAAELDPQTMCTLKPGTQIIEDMVPGFQQEGEFRFFEASSIRKVLGKYVFIYSRFTKDGEFGMPISNNTLAYAYSDNPLGPWKYGGTIIDGRARSKDASGKIVATGYAHGNTHGSICQINGRWWVFYHRHTGLDEFQRQAMVAPIEIKIEKDGRLAISEGEVTSEGFCTEGLNPLERTMAGWACHFTGPGEMTHEFPKLCPTGSYPQATGINDNILNASFSGNKAFSPIVNNVDGSVVGWKYFRMNELAKRDAASIELHLKPLGTAGQMIFMLDSPYPSCGGKEIGSLTLTGQEEQQEQYINVALKGLKGKSGKHALYILFNSDEKVRSLCELYDFIFRK